MTPINRFFTDFSDSRAPIFIRDGLHIDFATFKSDVARHATYFSHLGLSRATLYTENDFYTFCVYFMALLQSGCDVILPALLSDQNTLSLTDTPLITNRPDLFSSFSKIIPLDTIPSVPSYQFRDINNRTIHFFTSGSTGTPKQISKPFHTLSAEVTYHASHLSALASAAPVMIASIAPHHMYGLLWRFLFPLSAGIPTDTDLIFTPEELIEKQSAYPNIIFATTPSFLDCISKYKTQYDFRKNFSAIFTSGSMLSADTSASAMEIFGVSPIEIYGSTETGGIAFRQQGETNIWEKFDSTTISTDPTDQLIVTSPFSYKNPFTMSDIVTLTDDTHFILHGRTDRIVKIAEERISLPQAEQHLIQHPYINQAFLSAISQNNRTVIGAIISLTDAGRNALIANGRQHIITIIKDQLRPILPSVAIPRKIRLTHALPFTPQGKILKSDTDAIFSNRIYEPVITNLITTPDCILADLTFLPDSEYFRGHFTDHPILPGVIQLHFVMTFIKMFFGIAHSGNYTISKLKFSSLILPGTTIRFQLNRLSQNCFSFQYESETSKHSSGKITFQNTQHV